MCGREKCMLLPRAFNRGLEAMYKKMIKEMKKRGG